MDLALNNLQRLICHKINQPANQTNKQTNKQPFLTKYYKFGTLGQNMNS